MPEAKQSAPKYLAIGRITAPHGIRGEVRVDMLTDFPERFKPGFSAFLGTGSEDPEARPVKIVAARPHKGGVLVKLDAVPDRNTAELLRDRYLLIPESDAMPLGSHENYLHDLVGLQVETTEGRFLGELTEVLFTKANDVYVLHGPDGEVLLPATRDVVLQVDVPAHRMVVALPDGLLDDAVPDADEDDEPEPAQDSRAE
jgi:16S rRNA processing protein RimM